MSPSASDSSWLLKFPARFNYPNRCPVGLRGDAALRVVCCKRVNVCLVLAMKPTVSAPQYIPRRTL